MFSDFDILALVAMAGGGLLGMVGMAVVQMVMSNVKSKASSAITSTTGIKAPFGGKRRKSTCKEHLQEYLEYVERSYRDE